MSGTDTASRPIRVLHLRDSPWVDGPGRTILESAGRFDPMRVEYHVAVFVDSASGTHPMLQEGRARGVSIHAIHDSGGIDSRIVRQVLSLVDRLSIDVLHASDLRSSIYSILVRMRREHLLIVRTAHGWIANTPRRRVLRLVDKALLRFVDHVSLVSHAMRELVPLWWLPSDHVSVVHNALPLESYGRADTAHERVAADVTRCVHILNVGRLSPEKGQDLLIRAFARVREHVPGLRLRIAGIGPMESALRALVAELGVSDDVDFLGYIADMPAQYSASDLVVQSSLTEGLPNVILEAAFLGIPILATDVGGTREIVEHGRSGWLIEPGSVDAIVDGLQEFLAEPGRFLEMTRAARQKVLEQFSFSARIEKITRIYEGLACR